MLNLDAIKARLNGITPGKWRWEGVDWRTIVAVLGADYKYITGAPSGPTGINSTPDDATFIVNAPGDIRALVGEVERLYKLERYTSHKYNCDLSTGAVTGKILPCSCGLSALLMPSKE